MRSRAWLMAAAVALALFLFPLYAAAADPTTAEMPAGQILFHQKYAEIDSWAKTGVRVGTSSPDDAKIELKDGDMYIRTIGGGRAYALLPAVARQTSYTVEFTFRFAESGHENGSIAYLLACRGDEPTNVTSLVIRGNGTIDDFTVPDKLRDTIRYGYTATVIIPVEDGTLHHIRVVTAEDTYELERSSVLLLRDGGAGFSVRGTAAAVSEVWIVNGCGYEEKTGDTASYTVEITPEKETPGADGPGGAKAEDKTGGGKVAPNTKDPFRENTKYTLPAAVMSASVLICGYVFRRRKT